MRIDFNGFDFAMEDKLIKKLETMCKRVIKPHPKLDAFLTNSGYEGDGKTNTSIAEAAFIKLKTGYPINLFFKTSSCIAFAQNTEKQIIILDEPSFESLSSDHATNVSKDLLRLTSTMREKRHFVIINFAKFWKFPEFLVVDRALGMVHMDSKRGKDPGRFLFIRGKKLEWLWNEYHRNRRKRYARCKSFGGRVPYIMEEIWDKLDIRVEGKLHATYADYKAEKNKAIASIGTKTKQSKTETRLADQIMRIKYSYSTIPGKTILELAKHARVNRSTIIEWRNLPVKEGVSLRTSGFGDSGAADSDSTMADNQENEPESEGEETYSTTLESQNPQRDLIEQEMASNN